MSDKREIRTEGGAYVEGDVHVSGGDFVGRDKIEIHRPAEGVTVGEFVALLSQVRQLASQAALDKDTAEVIEVDFRVVEEQAKRPQPNRAIILSKLKGAAELLTAATAAVAAAKPLLPLVQRAVEWAGQLFK